MVIQERVDERRDDAVEAPHTKIEIIQFRSPAPKAPEID
jgi:hypothetical protein